MFPDSVTRRSARDRAPACHVAAQTRHRGSTCERDVGVAGRRGGEALTATARLEQDRAAFAHDQGALPRVFGFSGDGAQKHVVVIWIVVENAEAFAALALILERTKYLVEPAASCCLAAAQNHRGSFQPG